MLMRMIVPFLDPSRYNLPTIPADFETRMMRIGEVFEDSSKGDLQANSRLGISGSWLVPTCLSCKILLPLFGHAYARWLRIVTVAASRSSSEASTCSNPRRSAYLSSASDSPAILLADVMHWFAVLDLRWVHFKVK